MKKGFRTVLLLSACLVLLAGCASEPKTQYNVNTQGAANTQTSANPSTNTAAGNAAPQNIQRHPICPFHEAQISAGVKSAGIGSAISQLAICAPRIPNTIVS